MSHWQLVMLYYTIAHSPPCALPTRGTFNTTAQVWELISMVFPGYTLVSIVRLDFNTVKQG